MNNFLFEAVYLKISRGMEFWDGKQGNEIFEEEEKTKYRKRGRERERRKKHNKSILLVLFTCAGKAIIYSQRHIRWNENKMKSKRSRRSEYRYNAFNGE